MQKEVKVYLSRSSSLPPTSIFHTSVSSIAAFTPQHDRYKLKKLLLTFCSSKPQSQSHGDVSWLSQRKDKDKSTGWCFQASQNLQYQHLSGITTSISSGDPWRWISPPSASLPKKAPAIGEWSHLHLQQLWHRHLAVNSGCLETMASASCNLLHKKFTPQKKYKHQNMWLEASTWMGLEPVATNKSITFICFSDLKIFNRTSTP